MFISDTAIKRPVLTVVAMLILVVFGIVALTQLDTDEFPEIDAPIVVVAIPYPGASPDVVEREVIEPIEEVISGISNQLPPEMEEPILTRFDPQDQPIVSLTLSSAGLPGAELTRHADPDITRRFRGIQGVA